MTVKELAYVALKVTGVYCVIKGLFLLAGVISAARLVSSGELIDVGVFFAILISFVLMMLLGFFLLKFTKRAGRMIGLPELGKSSEIVKVEKFQTVAFSIVGVILVATAIPKFFYIMSSAAYEAIRNISIAGKPARGMEIWTPDNIGQLVEIAILAALGLFLFFRADGITRLWQQFHEKKKLIEYK